jgi:branched-subunit amino acid transport protein
LRATIGRNIMINAVKRNDDTEPTKTKTSTQNYTTLTDVIAFNRATATRLGGVDRQIVHSVSASVLFAMNAPSVVSRRRFACSTKAAWEMNGITAVWCCVQIARKWR